MLYVPYVQITLPSQETTYWCIVQELPQNIIDTKQYVTKVSELYS